MLDYYKTNDFDILFCYFLDTYIIIQKHGRFQIPPCLLISGESKSVSSFLMEGIELLENAYNKELFDILLSSLYFKFYKECTNLLEINKLVLINSYIKFLYNDDFISLLKTSNMWSDCVKQYSLSKIY
ncbi:MAG: hypothetical protein RRY80_11865, partial [Lachnospiraceae bacterium]